MTFSTSGHGFSQMFEYSSSAALKSQTRLHASTTRLLTKITHGELGERLGDWFRTLDLRRISFQAKRNVKERDKRNAYDTQRIVLPHLWLVLYTRPICHFVQYVY